MAKHFTRCQCGSSVQTTGSALANPKSCAATRAYGGAQSAAAAPARLVHCRRYAGPIPEEVVGVLHFWRGVGFRVPVGSRISTSPCCPGVWGPPKRDFIPGSKAAGTFAARSKVKRKWIYTSTPHSPSRRSALAS
jgi:hypothetical protein